MKDVVAFGEYRFDRANRILSRNGNELPLPPRALAVLAALLEDPGAIVSKQALLDSVWSGAFVSENSLSEAVRLVRQALEDDAQEAKYIQTVHRRGYRFIATVTPVRDEVIEAPEPVVAQQAVPRPRSRRWIWIAAVPVVAALAYFAWCASNPAKVTPPVTRFAIAVGARESLEWRVPSLAVSPDGQHVVYVVRRGEETVLFHRDVSGFHSREILGTRGAGAPFFSPDGRRVGFHANGQLFAVPLSGGTPAPLVSVSGISAGAAWGADDTLVFSAGEPSLLYRVRPGAPVKALTRLDATRGEASHLWPQMLPGGDAVLFTAWSTTLSDARVEWLSLKTGERRTVLTGANDARYAQGLLICTRSGGAVFVARFDPRRGQLLGAALPLLRDAAVFGTIGIAHLAVGGRTIAYLPQNHSGSQRRLHWLVDGKRTPLPIPPRFYRNFRAGPHRKIAVTVLARDRSDVWIIDADTGTSSRLTFDGFNVQPVWSPDGRWVAFASKTTGAYNIYRRRADGSGGNEKLFESAQHQLPLAWSPDGRELLLRQTDSSTGFDLWVLDVATRRARPWLRTPAGESHAAWSPDGKWIAYMSDETGRWEIYVQSYPRGGGRWQVSNDTGSYPSWLEDGSGILFLRGDDRNELWKTPVRPRAGELNPGRAIPLIAGADVVFGAGGPGGVIVLMEDKALEAPRELRVMVDWTATLPKTLHDQP